MKKILVPCDFSKPAINAYRFALTIAARSGGTIHLLYAIELPVLYDTTLMPVLSMEQDFMADLTEKTKRRFEKLREKKEAGNVKIRSDVVFGPVDRMIIGYVKEKDIDVIIMGSHGTSDIASFFIGSNAEKIVRNSPVPVFVLKDTHKGQMKNIVFPVSFENGNQKDLMSRVKSLQSFFGAHLYVVRINTPGGFTRDPDTLEKLNSFVKQFDLKNSSIHIFNDFDERSGIITFAEMNKADLIFMGTHARKGIAHFFNGSITEDVANRVKCPIVTYSLK